MDDGCLEPFAELGPPGTGGGQECSVTAGDAGFVADLTNQLLSAQLVEGAISKHRGQRPDPADVAVGLQARRDR
jgi:hypothetical protein